MVSARAFAACFLLAASSTSAQVPATASVVERPNVDLAVVPLQVFTANGRVRKFKVEYARTAAEQATGMMFRRKVPANTGMLFPFTPMRLASFWMENTYVSLDIIFIGPDRRILNIAGKAKPLSREFVRSAGPVIAVLELAGGTAARIGLQHGDRVEWTVPR